MKEKAVWITDKTMAHHLVWFKSDLRTHDNPALYHACLGTPEKVTAIFILTPQQYKKHDWGSNKVYFVLNTLKKLSVSLAKLNIPLLILETPSFKTIPKLLLELTTQHKITSFFYNAEYEVNELARDKTTTELLQKNKIEVQSFHDQTIIPPNIIKTQKGDFYTVYTPFKRAWMEKMEISRPVIEYPVPKKQNSHALKPSIIPDVVKNFDENIKIQKLWPAGEDEAQKRLFNFCDEDLGSYKDNRDFPARHRTSSLSPYLAVGAISTKSCFLKAEKNKTNQIGITTWLNELIWREFYRHILVGFPRVCKNKPFKLATDNIPWEKNEKKLHAWQKGETGFPLVDAAMKQLIETGWMHNRLRMIVSMFLVKDLHIDWRDGEKFFMQHLIDADFASNNGGWQWAASTGTDAVPYFRIFNPATQSERFDPDGTFIKKFLPELRLLKPPFIHAPEQLTPLERQTLKYPSPICNHSQARLKTMELFKKYS